MEQRQSVASIIIVNSLNCSNILNVSLGVGWVVRPVVYCEVGRVDVHILADVEELTESLVEFYYERCVITLCPVRQNVAGVTFNRLWRDVGVRYFDLQTVYIAAQVVMLSAE